MKVLAVVGTPRRKGLISSLCQRILDGAEENGHQVKMVNLYDYDP
ncbi:MAG: NADPH-dependent reductase [Halanaerobiales bacterium]|nr:NADPH-dependent reductase [Halanaerobiales bacterium]